MPLLVQQFQCSTLCREGKVGVQFRRRIPPVLAAGPHQQPRIRREGHARQWPFLQRLRIVREIPPAQIHCDCAVVVQLNPIRKIKEIRIVIDITIISTQFINLNLTV